MSKEKPVTEQDLNRAERWFRQGIPEALTDQQGRTLSGLPSRRDRDTQIEQEEQFNERSTYIAGRNLHLTPSTIFANQLNIVFPSTPCYGPTHGKHTSQLACYIAEVGGVTSVDDLETVKTAGLLHDIARVTSWYKPDPGHQVRSAELADRFIREDAAGVRSPLREPVCRLIARHHDPEPGPLGEALRDADLLESARLAPNTGEGFKAVQEARKRLQTRWARDPAALQRWMEKYGWTDRWVL